MIARTYHNIARIDEIGDFEYTRDTPAERVNVVPQQDANVISSRVADTYDESTPGASGELHAPVIDIDFPIAVIPSSTPGHFHLYIEKQMTWPQYERILDALRGANVIEEGYYHASCNRKATYVRKPDVVKVGPYVEINGEKLMF